MMRCRAPRGCNLWAFGDDVRCYFHAKQSEGAFDTDPPQDRQGLHLSSNASTSINPSAVCSDEQVEMAGLMAMLGAKPNQVRRAFAKGQPT